MHLLQLIYSTGHGCDGGRDLRPARTHRLRRRCHRPHRRTGAVTTTVGRRKGQAMSLLTINKLTTSVGAEVIGIDPSSARLRRPVGRSSARRAGRQRSPGLSAVLTSIPQAQVAFCRRLGEIDHSSDGHHPVAGHLSRHPRQVEELLGRLFARPPSTGTSTAAPRRVTNIRRRPRFCRARAGRRAGRRHGIRQLRTALTTH